MSKLLFETLFTHSKTIAVVGLSDQATRDSYRVAAYLLQAGYEIYPVNPGVSSVLGRQAYRDLLSVPVPIDIVDVFRRPEFVPEIVEQAITVKAKALWLQFDTVHDASALRAEAAGIQVIRDRCIKIDHAVWIQQQNEAAF